MSVVEISETEIRALEDISWRLYALASELVDLADWVALAPRVSKKQQGEKTA